MRLDFAGVLWHTEGASEQSVQSSSVMCIICPICASGWSSEKPYKDILNVLTGLVSVCFHGNRSFLLSGANK